jgi:transcription initiation factor IIE alpha subunit
MENRFMDEGFVPPQNYAICPSCKEKVDLPKKISFRLRSKIMEFKCPNCGSSIEYMENSSFAHGPPYKME